MPVKFAADNSAHYAWTLLHQTQDSIIKYEEDPFGKAGITPQQFSVLAAVKQIRQPVILSNVATWLDRKANSITLIVDRMEKSGLITRKRDSNDRRVTHLTLTPKGEEIYEKALKISQGIPEDILGALSQREMENLANSLAKIRDRVFERQNITAKVIDASVLARKD
jgi:DNA-binding MarR family transcriptional regulator